MGHNYDRWASWYRGMRSDDYGAYGSTETYLRAYEFLKNCLLIEDWGSGRGYFSTLCKPGQCRNIDGSRNPHTDIVVDLEDYHSDVSGILMRHVLDHNYKWRRVLYNALASFRDRMAIVLIAPFADSETVLKVNEDIGVPDIAFSRGTLEGIFSEHGVLWRLEEAIPSISDYHQEHIYYLKKGFAR